MPIRWPALLLPLASALLPLGTARAGGVVLFDEQPGALGGQNQCASAGCWTNYLRVTDIDGDGDLDIIFVNYAGFFTAGSPQPLVIYTNDGSGNFTDASAAALDNFSGRIRQVAVGDVDGDGDVDIYAPDGIGNPDAFFINDGGGEFTDEADVRLPGVGSRAGATRFGDFDGDGDLDLFVADGYTPGGSGEPGHIYINDGSGVFDESVGAVPGSFPGQDIDDVDIGDFDRDFDLDLLVNAHAGPSEVWLNDGNGMFSASSLPPLGNPGFHYNPGICDVDGDGDLDAWIDNVGGASREQLLINDGNGSFVDATNNVSGNVSADDNGVVCVDVDLDGDFDAAIVSLSAEERILLNNGAGEFVGLGGAFEPAGDPSLWAEFGDLNGDGRLDAVTGQGEGNPMLNRVYFGTAGVAVDQRAPRVVATEQIGPTVPNLGQPPVRFAVSDATVTDEGPRLARAWVLIDPDAAAQELDAWFVGGDVYFTVLPAARAGTSVSYRACAEDMAGNVACGSTLTYEVSAEGGDDSGSTSGTGTSGTTPGNEAGGTSASDDSPASNSTASGFTSADASTSGGGTGGDSSGPSTAAGHDGGGGCGCRHAYRTGPRVCGLALLLLGLGRRRRRRDRAQ